MLAGAVALLAIGNGCRQRMPGPAPMSTAAAPQLMPPGAGASQHAALLTTPSAVGDTANEIHVDVDTHGADVDVRTLLDFIAKSGGFTLVYSPGIAKRVRVQLTNVPVSVALETVLSLAGLTLGAATPATQAPGATSVVFYQLPVNVDSLPVEAIMKRFGVGRTIAELIVESRTNKP
jgi:hypothetical protein